MFNNCELKKFTIGKELKLEVLESGNLFDIYHKNIRIKLLHANNYEKSPSNIFIRMNKAGKIFTGRLLGVGSNSSFKVENNKIYYSGKFHDVAYKVVLSINENTFFTEVFFEACENVKVQLFYGLDFAISDKYAIRNNESYVCQYVDHQVFKDQNGFKICSRQNQGVHCYLEQGSFTKTIGYCTDGFQFYKTSYKLSNEIESLIKNELPNEVYQYEFAYCGLQTEEITLTEEKVVVFYGSYLEQIEGVVNNPILTNQVEALYKEIKTETFPESFVINNKIDMKISFDNVFNSEEISDEELKKLYPNQELKEIIDGKCKSFFLDNHAHVILPSKEFILERPSGNILISGNHMNFEEVLASTIYIFGVFNSQIVCGNTSFNKLMSNIRNALNIQKITGQRLFVEIDGEYKLLCMPMIFENGLNYGKWIYKIEDDYLEIKTYISENDSLLKTDVKSHNNKRYSFIVSNHITMNQNEYETNFSFKNDNSVITFYPSDNSMMKKYPNISFSMKVDKNFELSDDRIFFEDNISRNENLLTLKINESEFSLAIMGNTFGKEKSFNISDFSTASKNYIEQFSSLLSEFELSIDNQEKENIKSINHLAYWYTHDALVHFTSPHGLEQYNGAAWGARDVCQGPAEYFLATLHYDYVKKIIIEVFRHQFIENGDWPQWFMFDRFYNICQHDSHGDIIVWPARLLGLYLASTKDYSILKEEVPYMSMTTNDFTSEKYSILDHLKNEIKSIESNFIPNTYLSSYGGGDWDDTLQPAHKEYAKNMVSGWTVALTYEMFSLLSQNLSEEYQDLKDKYSNLADKIKNDYNKYIIIDGIPAGFILFEEKGIKPIIHPNDKETNIEYRLLPLNRGIISELFSDEQKDRAIDIINNHLKFPDGAHLMNKTVPYNGGLNTYFQRAETAANFGREISLQYCHAHIRYCEALAKINSEEMYKNLMIINPIIMHEMVKNSLPRQRNSYFSSSDGNFKTRYEAMENFNGLKNGTVKVKNGWRVYSSGPGIYVFQVLKNMLGIKTNDKNIIIDPTLPEELSGLNLKLKVFNKNITFKFIKNSKNDQLNVLINGKNVNTKELVNKYKRASLSLALDDIENQSELTIYY